MLVKSIAIAQADTLDAFARDWAGDGRSGAAEVSRLIAQASKLARKIANDEPIVFEEVARGEPPTEDPKQG